MFASTLKVWKILIEEITTESGSEWLQKKNFFSNPRLYKF